MTDLQQKAIDEIESLKEENEKLINERKEFIDSIDILSDELEVLESKYEELKELNDGTNITCAVLFLITLFVSCYAAILSMYHFC